MFRRRKWRCERIGSYGHRLNNAGWAGSVRDGKLLGIEPLPDPVSGSIGLCAGACEVQRVALPTS